MLRYRIRSWSTAAAMALAGTALPACGGQNALVDRTTVLEERVQELERANRHLNVRLDAYEASVTLIEDEVTALGIAQRQSATVRELDVVRIAPAPDPEARYGRDSGSAYGAGLPVEEVYPEEWSGEEDGDEVVDIVVSDDKIQKYFGGGAPAPTAPAAAKSSGPRSAKAPVVQGERLAVVPSGSKADAKLAPVAAAEDPIEYYKKGLKHYRQQEFAPAIELFTAFLDANPPTDYVDNALYWLGECHYGLGNYAEAATYFHRIVQDYPDANKVPDALLKVGLTYQRLDKSDSAREVMYYLIEAYPKTEAARVARERLDQMSASS